MQHLRVLVELSVLGLQDPLAEAGLAVVPQVVLQLSLLIICNYTWQLDHNCNAQITADVLSLTKACSAVPRTGC